MAGADFWIGLDVGHVRTAVCVTDHAGGTLAEIECASTPDELHSCIDGFAPARVGAVGVEAGVGIHLVRALRVRGYTVVVHDGRKAAKFLAITRQKRDISDAAGLAQLSRLGAPLHTEVRVKSLEAQNIRSRLVIRRKLLQHRMAMDSIVLDLLRLHGGDANIKPHKLASSPQIDSGLGLLMQDGLEVDRDVKPLIAIARELRAHLRELDARLAREARAHPVCSRLLSVPGVGPITALAFYSAIDDPSRFHPIKNIGAFLGLTPSVYQSGTMSRQRGISKAGDKLARTCLVTSAMILMSRCKTECRLREQAAALDRRIGRPRAKLAIARKLAVILAQVWLSGEAFIAYPDLLPANSMIPGAVTS